MPYKTKPTVLLVEADMSLRRLIALGLHYRGMHVIAASSLPSLPPADVHQRQPDLLICDIDGTGNGNASSLTMLERLPASSKLPVVVLTWECRVAVPASQDAPQSQITCLPKPFDARVLYTTIDQILETRALQEAAHVETLLYGARPASTMPSLWPLIAAAGLLLAFIGLMGQFIITLLGLLIVVVALLWWTLGTTKNMRTRVRTTVSSSVHTH